MKTYILLFLSTIMIGGCMGQSKSGNHKKNDQQNPKVDVKVNKEYDKDGNLVRYDSIYTSYYSSIDEDSLFADSIMQEFGSYFNRNFPFIVNQHLNNIMLEDSIWSHDFFTDDFFSNNFSNYQQSFNQMFYELDSLKNRFFMQP